MKLKIASILFALFFLTDNYLFAQTQYEADWESLDRRPTPEWFAEAKFGVFIHWGLYSVPAWSPKGTYTEWYQYWLEKERIFGNGKFTGQEIPEYQRENYGENSTYYDFASMFKAEKYDPESWANLFKASGAKYVIMTSKHHDGFCLWDSPQANDARDLEWNSVQTGPERDLVEDFMVAIRNSGLKAGLYYSLYEWFHPWYTDRSDRFVTDHYHPQFKDLITRYQPDVIYADGEWDNKDDYWKSNELIAWLFNESVVKDEIVINDRWFQGSRFKHGGYYTNEYDAGAKENLDKPWEEIRGMGLSFGYNRNEDDSDYSTAQTLVLMLVDVVSQGGNLCLNIGPRGDGTIPEIMSDRLMEIGSWLELNGEAIYGTVKYDRSFQWSKGKKKYDFKKGKAYVEGNYILKQTVDPVKGMATKDIFFTKKGNDVFAIVPVWPDKKLEIKDIVLGPDAKITLVSTGENVKYKKSGKGIALDVSTLISNADKGKYAWAFKITNVK